MTAAGQRLHLRLFIEGVECPVVSAVIQAQKNAAAVASIQIPMNDEALDLRPRSLIHLFAYDSYAGIPPEQQITVGGQGIQLAQDPDANGLIPPTTVNVTQEQQTVDLQNQNYKLIFGGELMGIQFQKTPQSRAVVLQCADWSSYWDIAFQYQVGGFTFGGGGLRAAFTGAATTVFNDFLDGSGDIVAKLLQEPPRSYPSLKGTLLGGLMHIIEAIGGVYYGSRAIKGVNDFFSIAEMRLHLTQMIGANPFATQDETRLLSANGFGSLFSKTLGGLGKLVTIRQVLLALQRYIFHEVIPITAPRFIPALADPNSPQLEDVPLTADRDTAPLVQAATALKSRVIDLQNRQARSTTPAEATLESVSRGGLLPELRALADTATAAASKARSVGVGTGQWASRGDTSGIQAVAANFELVATRLGAMATQLQSLGLGGYAVFPLVSSYAGSVVTEQLALISDALQKVIDTKVQRRAQRTVSQPDPPARLITQVYRPDVWMVAPPRCNVFFPENYSQFSYGRNFQQEVTRMLLRTHSAFYGSDILFDGFYMAPSKLLGQRKGQPVAQGRIGIDPDLTDAPAMVSKDLMEHELFTGIIPAFERMSDLNLHALRGGSVTINNVKVGYAQLACNHIFFQYRFKSRDLSLSGKFNPYCVLGFPAVVIDKYLDANQLTNGAYDVALASKFAAALQDNANVPASAQLSLMDNAGAKALLIAADLFTPRDTAHYLGTPEMISHSLSAQQGGSTQIQMGYARTTNERTEFLGDNLAQSTTARRVRNQSVTSVVAALEPPKLDTTGYRGGRITAVQDVTDQFQKKQTLRPKTAGALGSSGFTSDTLIPLYIADRGFTGRQRVGTRVPVGVEQPASVYGPEVVALVGSGGSIDASTGEVLVSFRAYSIKELVGVYETDDTELPPEDLLFPPWYGESWRSNKIGAMYAYLFGTGAVTDPTVITPPNTAQPAQSFAGDGVTENTLDISMGSVLGSMVATPVNTAGQGQMPQAGAASDPSIPGGGVAGPPGDTTNQDIAAALGSVPNASPVTTAIDEIVKAYSLIRQQNFDTPQFVQTYTWRPIASMIDLFGTSDLSIDDTGYVTAGREGFHSRAFGDVDDLRQLVSSSDGPLPGKILGLTVAPSEVSTDEANDTDAKVSARLDTRSEKRTAVLRYLYALSSSRGIVLG